MKSISLAFGSFFIIMLFIGCDDKAQEEETNTTIPAIIETTSFTFETQTINKEVAFVIAEKNNFTFNTQKEITLLYLFDTSCVSCKGALPYLAQLKNKYPDDIYIMSVVHADATYDPRLPYELVKIREKLELSYAPTNKELLDKMVEHLKIEYKMPLSIIFHNGKIVQYYQGTTPIEIIEADIKYILKEN